MPTPLDGPSQNTRGETWQAVPMEQSTSTTHTSEQVISERILCSNQKGGSSTEEMIISDDPTSLVVSRKSERLSQPPERYSPDIFFTNFSKPTTYEEASVCADSTNWRLAMESYMNSTRENQIWNLVELLKNRRALPCRWGFRQVPSIRPN